MPQLRILTATLLAACILLAAAPPSGSAGSSARAASLEAPRGGVALISARSVPPDGWRRTTRGWERMEENASWSINQWIRFQQREESSNRLLGWFDCLAVVHPVSFAAGQLAVVFVLAASARRRCC